jgi:ankyrin repeat protein
VNARLKRRILKRGYNAGDGRLDEGATPLMRAARSADLAAMRLLIERGADPKATQKNGTTALQLAAGIRARPDEGETNPDPAAVRSVEAATLLLDRGADINATTAAGDTPAHAAVRNVPVLRLLAARGANLTIKNKAGRTPLDAALSTRPPSDEAAALLRQLTGEKGTTAEAPARTSAP